MTREHLMTTEDVKRTREKLLKQQNGCCKISGAKLELKDAVLDHSHDTQLVRGTIHRQLNAMLGKIEGAYNRMVKWWCPIPLPRLLRTFAYYLEQEKEEPLDIVHPGWIKRNLTDFNKLNSKSQLEVFKEFKVDIPTKNADERKKAWKKFLQSGKTTHEEVKDVLRIALENQMRGINDQR